MNFEIDVYISYAHLDDQPLTSEQPGWVSQFHAYLDKALTWKLGYRARIWRDLRLSGNESYANESAEALGKVAILVTVLSPCYVESEWCRREIEEFCRRAEQNGGVVVDKRPRIFKVIKRPTKSHESHLPVFMKDVLGYEFFIDKDGRALELDPAWPDQAQRFAERIKLLANDIGDLLGKLRSQDARSPSSLNSQSPLASPTSEQVHAPSLSSTEEHMRKNGVFVCYAREDERFALELAGRIKDSGILVWIDQWDIAEGDDWDRAIDDALYTSPGFLIVLSQTAIQSNEVRGELRAALNEKKYIFPVLYQDCPRPPRELLNIQWTDLRSKGLTDETAVQSLVTKIKAKLNQKET